MLTAWVSQYSCAYCVFPVRVCYQTLWCQYLYCNGSHDNCDSILHIGHSMLREKRLDANICLNYGCI